VTKSQGWIGVDLDGTIAKYDGWKGPAHIGDPIPAMVERVRAWLAAGAEVRVMTARMSTGSRHERDAVAAAIAAWTLKHIGVELEATCVKDYAMIELWDDRAVGVEPNTGRTLAEVAMAKGAHSAMEDVRATLAASLDKLTAALGLPRTLVPSFAVADALLGWYPPKPAAPKLGDISRDHPVFALPTLSPAADGSTNHGQKEHIGGIPRIITDPKPATVLLGTDNLILHGKVID
jgi:hypothetical protein